MVKVLAIPLHSGNSTFVPSGWFMHAWSQISLSVPLPPSLPQVPVSATPGRTKHFQTLYVSDHLMLCDCPGLVFPSLVLTKAEMVVSGILPIDQMRDHTPPISLVYAHTHSLTHTLSHILTHTHTHTHTHTLSHTCTHAHAQVCQRVPRSVLERVYGLSLPPPSEGEDPHRLPTALELLSAYGCGCGCGCGFISAVVTFLYLHHQISMVT